MEDQTDNESQQRGKNPEQPELRQRQGLPQHREDAVQPAGGEQRRGQRGGEVIERADERQRGRPDKDGAVVGEEFPEKGERDQRDGEGIEEHQHRDGVADDGAQAEVGEEQGNQTEDHRPDAVGRTLGKEACEGLRAAGDEAHGGLETGERHGRGEDQKADGAEVVLRDLREGDAAVFRGLEQSAALHADDGDGDVDGSHQQTAENTRADSAARHGVRLGHAEATDDLHDHDAEGKACQRVHGVVALEEAGEERLRGVSALRYDRADGSAGAEHRHDDQNAEEQQEAGVEHLADPDEDLARAEREEQRRGEEGGGERQQAEPHIAALRQHLLQSHGEGGGGAAGDGEERPDGQVEQAGEKHRVGLSHAAAELKEPTGAADAERRYTEQRQSYAGYTETNNRGPNVAAGHLTHVNGEDEVSGAEEHTEEHTGNVGVVAAAELLFHFHFSFFISTRRVRSAWCRMFENQFTTAAENGQSA